MTAVHDITKAGISAVVLAAADNEPHPDNTVSRALTDGIADLTPQEILGALGTAWTVAGALILGIAELEHITPAEYLREILEAIDEPQ